MKHLDNLLNEANKTKDAKEWFDNWVQELVYKNDIQQICWINGMFYINDDDGQSNFEHPLCEKIKLKYNSLCAEFGRFHPIVETTRRYRDFNSIANQEIKGKFVEREVMANVGTMVEFILNCETTGAPFTVDDIDNFWQYPEYSHKDTGEYFVGGTYEVLEEEKERVNDIVADLEDADPEDPKIDQYNDYLAELERLETEPAEIYEWWMVTGWLAEKLQEKGECIIPDFNLWGRCTTGQAILLDGVICSICEDLEILEGQKNAWK